MSKRYFWLQLKDDFFDNKEIRKLRKIPGGDTYTIIYQKMLLFCLKTGGTLVYEGTEDDLAEQLSLQIDEDQAAIEITLNYLQKNGLIERVSEDEFFLNKVPELTGSETDSAERMRKLRSRKNTDALSITSQCDALPLQSDNDVTNSDTNVRKSDGDIDIEIDTEKDIYPPLSPHGGRDDAEKAARTSTRTGFEAFWNVYPRKNDKGHAVKVWKRLRPDGELLAKMLRAIEAQKRSYDWTKDGGRFIPMPATWLNGMRWEDEVRDPPDDPGRTPPGAASGTVRTNEAWADIPSGEFQL